MGTFPSRTSYPLIHLPFEREVDLPKRSKAKTVGFHMQINSAVSVSHTSVCNARSPACGKKSGKNLQAHFFLFKAIFGCLYYYCK